MQGQDRLDFGIDRTKVWAAMPERLWRSFRAERAAYAVAAEARVQKTQPNPYGGYILDELFVGMTAEKHVSVTEQRIDHFADASHDFNPVHMDEAFASKTAYRGRIAHVLLSASFGSAVVGTILPGAGAIYLGQTLSFYERVGLAMSWSPA